MTSTSGLDRSSAELLLTAARLMENRYNERLRELGLTHASLRILATLNQLGRNTQAGLAKNLRLQPQTLGATLNRMEGQGLVLREPDASDGRTILVSMSPQGKGAYTKAAGIEAELEAEAGTGVEGLRESLAELVETLGAQRWDNPRGAGPEPAELPEHSVTA
jgi:MarR family transcriptional regulator, organic hydroperoxide resistance regulator